MLEECRRLLLLHPGGGVGRREVAGADLVVEHAAEHLVDDGLVHQVLLDLGDHLLLVQLLLVLHVLHDPGMLQLDLGGVVRLLLLLLLGLELRASCQLLLLLLLLLVCLSLCHLQLHLMLLEGEGECCWKGTRQVRTGVRSVSGRLVREVGDRRRQGGQRAGRSA